MTTGMDQDMRGQKYGGDTSDRTVGRVMATGPGPRSPIDTLKPGRPGLRGISVTTHGTMSCPIRCIDHAVDAEEVAGLLTVTCCCKYKT